MGVADQTMLDFIILTQIFLCICKDLWHFLMYCKTDRIPLITVVGFHNDQASSMEHKRVARQGNEVSAIVHGRIDDHDHDHDQLYHNEHERRKTNWDVS